jgi:hypothetical protein
MYYTSWQSLVKDPTQTRTSEWNIEPPRVLDLTPSPQTAFNGSIKIPDDLDQRHPAILALTALCMSRQHAVHLTCLLSLILIFHALWSRRQDLKIQRSDPTNAGKEAVGAGSRWVKLSEWRRTSAIISFSFIVTAFVVVLKVLADLLGLAKGYGAYIVNRGWIDARPDIRFPSRLDISGHCHRHSVLPVQLICQRQTG